MNCAEFRQWSDNSIEQELDGFMLEATNAIDDILGSNLSVRQRFENKNKKSQEIYYSYSKVYQKLLDVVVKHGEYFRYAKSPEDFLVGMKEYLFRRFKLPVEFLSDLNSVPDRTYLSMLVTVNDIIDGYSKEGNALKKSIMPAVLYTSKLDSFGALSRIVKHCTEITELVKSATQPYLRQVKKLESGFKNLLINSVEDVTPDYVIEPIHDIPTKNTDYRMVSFLGTIEKDGIKYHKVIGYSGNESKEMLMDYGDIDKVDILSGVNNYYLHKLGHEIQSGEVRNYVFKDKIDPAHREFIYNVLLHVSNNDDTILRDMRNVSTIVVGDKEYFTMAVKAMEESDFAKRASKEWYNVYLLGEKDKTTGVFTGYRSTKNRENVITMEQLRQKAKFSNVNYFQDGYYKAEGYGKVSVLNDNFKTNRDFIKFNYMTKQPKASLMSDTVEVEGGESNNLWTYIFNKRAIDRNIDEDLKRGIQKEQEEYRRLFLNKDNDFLKNLKAIYGLDGVEDVIDSIRYMFHMGSKLFLDKEKGIVATPNSTYSSIKENHAVYMFEDDVVISDLQAAIDEITNRRDSIKDITEEDLAMMNEKIEQFEMALRAKLNQNVLFSREDLPLTMAERNVFTKNRTDFTSVMERRKDAQVFHDYLDSNYYSLEKTHLITNLLSSINDIAIRYKDQPGLAKAQIETAINSVKKAIGDSSVSSKIGGIDLSFQKMADLVNVVTRGDMTADGAKMATTILKSLMSMNYLGLDGAVMNKTQVYNFFIDYSSKIMRRSKKIHQGKDEFYEKDFWDYVIDQTGVENLVTGFTDALAKGGDIGASDMGLIDTKSIIPPIPTKSLTDFVRLLFTARQSAKDGMFSNEEIDSYLKSLESIRLDSIESASQKISAIENKILSEISGRKKAALKRIISVSKSELKKIKDPRQRRDIITLRKNFVELMLVKKDTSPEKVEMMIENIVGKVANNRLKRMVSAKLGWWPEGEGVIGGLASTFTFLEGEREMRREGVIGALLFADQLGVLGKGKNETIEITDPVTGNKKNITINSKFTSDKAKRIARSYIAMTMYGMSAVNLGDAFSGFGESIFQFKGYTIQQAIHDHHIISTMLNGNMHGKYNPLEITQRLSKAIYTMAVKKQGDKVDKDTDIEAIRAMRFIMTRGIASVVATTLEVVRPFISALRLPGADVMTSLFRGAQNPQLGVFFRFFVKSLLVASMYNDDDDKLINQAFYGSMSVAMLFMPVWITGAAIAVFKYWQTFKD